MMYYDAFDNVGWILPQKVPKNVKSTYWSFTVEYQGMEKYGISWEKFYQMFNDNGGDGFTEWLNHFMVHIHLLIINPFQIDLMSQILITLLQKAYNLY